ncbi:MAG: hypothetical protein KA369_05230 [Spirochaetes bacterium]|nr:hypothetical protein [Spirochaetota bacterium]
MADFILNGIELDLLCINASALIGNKSTSFMEEIAELMDIVTDTDTRYYNHPSDQGFYANAKTDHEKNFYNAMDEICANSDISYDVITIAKYALEHIKEKDPSEIEETISDNIGTFSDPDFKNDTIDLSTKLAKLLIVNDYPIWVDGSGNVVTRRKSIDPGIHTNTDMGNSVKGVIQVLNAFNKLFSNDSASRDIVYDILREDIRTLVKTNATRGVIKDAVNNLAYYNSADGAGYNTSDYHSDSNGIYVNSELKETIREIFPGLVKLFIRNDSTGTKYPDYSIAYDTRGQSPLEAFTCALGTLKEGGIDYTAVDLEPSLRRMMDYNAFGKRRTDSGTTNVSYLDHFLYAIVSAAKFGFLTRQGSDGEPSANSGRGHGLSTNGVLTVTDVIYALDMSSGTIGDLTTTLNSIPNYLCFYLRDDIVNAIENMNLYDMALDHRVEQAEYISRSSGSFTTSQMGLHKFYMGGDYPIASLVPSACAGDAGLPNGGENAVTPTSNTTTMSTKTSVSQNDFRTYYPKVADGLGATNTAEFLLSLIPRACWDGAGPFYYAPSGAETKSFSWPGKGTRTVHVYYKPNGEIYAYVYKPSSSSSAWEYYYPVSGNDLADETGQRSNRYLEKIESDYYLVKFKFVNEYLTPTDYVAVPPVNPDGGSYASPNSKFRMKLIKASDNPASQKFYLEEKYKQTDPRRECKSQEEAIYRNYQWLCFDKKLAFVIPLHVGLMTNVEFGGYLFAEGNGFLGLVNSRKGPQNGYWLSNETDFPIPEYANSGIGIGDKTTGNSPDYMESHIPGDGRLTLLLSDNFCNLLPGLDTPGLFFSAIIGKGYAFPGAIACSIPTVLRLGFLQEAMVTADSTDIANESSAVWQNRNKLLPLIVALTGSLRDVTRYNASTTGHNYNYTGKHKLPIAELLEGVLFPLAKPHMRYLTDTAHSSGSTAYWGTRWLQRVENESNGTFSCFTPNIKNETDTDYFAPKKELRTLISILAGNGPKTSDGLIPLIADNTRLVSRVLALLQNLGGAGKAAERQTLFKGLEQITSSVKAGQSETMTRGISLSDNTSYKWMFTAREEDILLDDLLTYDGPVLPDDLRWDDFDSAFDLLKKFMDGEKDITGNIINIMNAVLTNQLTDPETESLVYVAGKLFGKYADNTWIYHGQTDDFDALYKLCTYLPYLHADLQDAGSGKNYLNLIDNVLWLLQNESSLLYYIVDNMNTRYSSEQVFKDLHDFSHSEIVYGSNAVVWRDMSNLLNEISGLAGNPLSPEELTVMFGHYGYQQN